jgi:hypothetical protein
MRVAPFSPGFLLPGDTLLYYSKTPVDYIVALKTWTWASHVEWYRGDGFSYASRNGIGVNKYPIRTDSVAAVLRPQVSLDFDAIDKYFLTVRGQKYDWKGLLCFTLAVKQGAQDRQFCSELWTNIHRAGGAIPFQPQWSADRTPPSFCLVTPILRLVWSDGRLF